MAHPSETTAKGGASQLLSARPERKWSFTFQGARSS